ncbi:hypothetical protein DN068_19965 [Taibaiella soli]|uniref:PepSY domain-containing protein n=2 Tax=Taibaiella soli TaxID=1649169 RepID=A0A2W2A6S1_9BACT|nr:hypothetical protein DN068_19965 [Taibaiella soli]
MKYLLVVLVLAVGVCQGQEKKVNNTDSMEYLDLSKYENWPRDKNLLFTKRDQNYVKDSVKVRIVFGNDFTQIEIQRVNSPYRIIKSFYTSTRRLHTRCEDFYSQSFVGLFEEYDIHGKLVKQIDKDKPYPFSIDDLRKKIREEYDVDIISDFRDDDPTKIIISRWEGYTEDTYFYKKGVPMYQMQFLTKDQHIVNLEIDARNGAIVSKSVDDEWIFPPNAWRKDTTSEEIILPLSNDKNDQGTILSSAASASEPSNLLLAIVVVVFVIVVTTIIYLSVKKDLALQ